MHVDTFLGRGMARSKEDEGGDRRRETQCGPDCAGGGKVRTRLLRRTRAKLLKQCAVSDVRSYFARTVLLSSEKRIKSCDLEQSASSSHSSPPTARSMDKAVQVDLVCQDCVTPCYDQPTTCYCRAETSGLVASRATGCCSDKLARRGGNRVRVWVGGGGQGVTVLGKKRVTLRIGGEEEERVSMEEPGDGDCRRLPPNLPPRPATRDLKRKNLCGFLGLERQEAEVLGLQERGGRKDLTLFLGLKQEVYRRREGPTSFLGSLLGRWKEQEAGEQEPPVPPYPSLPYLLPSAPIIHHSWEIMERSSSTASSTSSSPCSSCSSLGERTGRGQGVGGGRKEDGARREEGGKTVEGRRSVNPLPPLVERKQREGRTPTVIPSSSYLVRSSPSLDAPMLQEGEVHNNPSSPSPIWSSSCSWEEPLYMDMTGHKNPSMLT